MNASNGRDAAPPGGEVAQVPELPEIVLRAAESEVIEEALAALAADPTLYQWGGKLAHVVRDPPKPRPTRPRGQAKGPHRDPSAPRIAALKGARLRELVTRNVRLVKRTPKGPAKRDAEDGSGTDAVEWVQKPAHPPDWLVKGIEARDEWPGIRPLRGVIETPALRPDGTILSMPGYDAATGLLYHPPLAYSPIPERPTQADARGAVGELLEVVRDFPFARDAHRAGWLAAVLTPLARPAFDGPAPLCLIDATTPGSGKGLLADCTAMIATGRDATKSPYPAKEVEVEKLITALALEGDPLVLFDNVVGTLGGPNLDLALTSTTWRGRVLGFSATTGRMPLPITWMATGNNCDLGPDTSRRTLHIRLESQEEKPEERAGFAHPRLLEWVREERTRLVAAALTILRAYVVAGRPAEDLPTWGSYEEWSALVRQAVVWAGQPDPGSTREALRQGADREQATLRSLITGWLELDPQRHGFKVAEVIAAVEEQRRQRMRDPNAPRLYPALEGALAEITPHGGDLPSPKSLGRRLAKVRGRVIDKRAFESRDDHGTAVWLVRDVTSEPAQGGLCGFGGSPYSPSRARKEEVDEEERAGR